MFNFYGQFNEEEINNRIYELFLERLPDIEGEISNYDIKQLILDVTKSIISYDVEWGDPKIYGKYTILIHGKNKIMQLNASKLIEAIRSLHQKFLEETDFFNTGTPTRTDRGGKS